MLNSVIRPSILGNFLNKYSKIEYDNKYLYLFIKNKKEESFSWREATGFVKINSGIFNSSIEFTFDSTHLKINFLKKSDCENSFNIINELLKNIIDERITSKKNILHKYTQLEYLRDSNVVNARK